MLVAGLPLSRRPRKECPSDGLPRSPRLEGFIHRATPELHEVFARIRARLQARSENLAVLPVTGIGWNDLGDPARVRATQERIGWHLTSA